jgi:hypothetical protein
VSIAEDPDQHGPSSNLDMTGKPLLLIVRDPVEWPSTEFITLFEEEGYVTRDISPESLNSITVDQREPYGAIGS